MTIYTKTQAAKTLGISTRKLDRLREEGKAPYRKIGDRVIFTQSDLITLLDACAIPATALPTDRESKEMAKATGYNGGGAGCNSLRNGPYLGGNGNFEGRAGSR